jgi:hypothetical protein
MSMLRVLTAQQSEHESGDRSITDDHYSKRLSRKILRPLQRERLDLYVASLTRLSSVSLSTAPYPFPSSFTS